MPNLPIGSNRSSGAGKILERGHEVVPRRRGIDKVREHRLPANDRHLDGDIRVRMSSAPPGPTNGNEELRVTLDGAHWRVPIAGVLRVQERIAIQTDDLVWRLRARERISSECLDEARTEELRTLADGAHGRTRGVVREWNVPLIEIRDRALRLALTEV